MAKGKKSKKGKKDKKKKSSDGEEEIRQEGFEEGFEEGLEEVGQEACEEIGQEVQGGRAEKIRQEGQRQQEPGKEGGCPPTGCRPQTGGTEARSAQA